MGARAAVEGDGAARAGAVGDPFGEFRVVLGRGAGGHDQRGGQVIRRHPVVQVFHGFFDDGAHVDAIQALGGFFHPLLQCRQVQRLALAIAACHVQGGVVVALLLLAQGGVLFTVDHIVTGDLVLAGAHQRQLNLILDFLDVQGAARGQAAAERVDHHVGELLHPVAHPAGA